MNRSSSSLSIIVATLISGMPIISASAQEAAAVRPPNTFTPGVSAVSEHAAAKPVSEDASATRPVVKTPGRIIVPASSVVRPEDRGLRAHTDLVVFAAEGTQLTEAAKRAAPEDFRSAAFISPAVNTSAESPGSLGCIYKLEILVPGCPRATTGTYHPSGGSNTIAIVDAYDNPYAKTDIQQFDASWLLTAANFTQIYCQPYNSGTGTCNTTNTPPAQNTGWGLEEALDIEWAHAMAPKAKILLIEAASNSFQDLSWANAWAGYYVSIGGGGEVTNSWGGSEFSGETAYDTYFNNYGGEYHPVVYLASGGDSGTVEYPSASPYVISAGGTTVNRDGNGNFVNETCWTGTGRGPSTVEPIPSWQSTVGGLAGSFRQTTDFSFDSDPNTGVFVYDQFNGGWFQVGGTSVASPSLAGIINNAGNFFYNTAEEGNLIYAEYVGKFTYPWSFQDVTPTGYDNCTGIGSNNQLFGK